MSAPGLPQLLVSHWQSAWGLDVMGAAAATIYLGAAHRLPGQWQWKRTASWLSGIGCILIALQSGFAAYDDLLLSAHMVQHVLLLLPAPLLLLLGRPVTLALRSASPDGRRRLSAVLDRARPLAHPLLCLVVFYAVVVGTHLPAVFDAALRHESIHYAQHLVYLVAGALFLWPIIGDPAGARRLSGLGAFGYIIAAMPACALVGAYLNRAPHVVYTPYAEGARQLGIAAVNDQAQAGAIMWVGAHMVLVALALWCLIAGMRADERRQQAIDNASILGPGGSPVR